MTEVFQKLFPQAYISRLLEQGLRADGRAANEVRPMHLHSNGVLFSSDSSSICTLGKTRVLCSIQYEVTSAFPVVPHIDVSLSHKNNKQLRLEPTLQRLCVGLLHNGLKQLEINASMAYVLKVNFTVIDDDGCLVDCCVYNMQRALQELSLPTDFASVVGDEEGETMQVKIKSMDSPLCLQVKNVHCRTFCIVNGEMWIADPTEKEESVLNSTFTIVVDKDNNHQILSVIKLGKCGCIAPKTLQQCVASVLL